MIQPYTKVQELFHSEFTDLTPPKKSTVVRIVSIFCTEYSVWNKVLKYKETALMSQKVEEIQENVHRLLINYVYNRQGTRTLFWNII